MKGYYVPSLIMMGRIWLLFQHSFSFDFVGAAATYVAHHSPQLQNESPMSHGFSVATVNINSTNNSCYLLMNHKLWLIWLRTTFLLEMNHRSRFLFQQQTTVAADLDFFIDGNSFLLTMKSLFFSSAYLRRWQTVSTGANLRSGFLFHWQFLLLVGNCFFGFLRQQPSILGIAELHNWGSLCLQRDKHTCHWWHIYAWLGFLCGKHSSILACIPVNHDLDVVTNISGESRLDFFLKEILAPQPVNWFSSSQAKDEGRFQKLYRDFF